MAAGLPGRLVTLEGPDGSGKSTQAGRLAAALRAAGRTVTLTREPGGTAVGERIRGVLLGLTGDQHAPLTDAFLFHAARIQNVAEVIRPALERGEIVVCDRYADSTLAYQGYGSCADLATLKRLEEAAIGPVRPDLTVLIDLPVEVGLARRMRGPAGEVSRFEADPAFDLAFHERVRAGYLEMARGEPARWRIVDGTAGEDTLAEEVLRVVLEALP
jgi:dTMP kinase